MWYIVCNKHGSIGHKKIWSKANDLMMKHITFEENDNCRVTLCSIKPEATNEQTAEALNEIQRKLNAKSHGQHVEIL